jgi:hypothetical protein
LSQGVAQPKAEAEVIVVPCADSGRAGCEVVRRAVELVAREASEVAVASPDDCPKRGRRFVVAVDGGGACRASDALEKCGVRPSAVVSAPGVLARAGLVRPGVDVRGRMEELAAALATAVQAALGEALQEVRDRRRYRDEMAPVMRRFRPLWTKFEALPPPPDGEAAETERSPVELLGKRSRNLFARFDEVVPPTEWSEEHDLFQDALLCIAYASEGWVAGDRARFDENAEKARVQVRPLLRRLDR